MISKGYDSQFIVLIDNRLAQGLNRTCLISHACPVCAEINITVGTGIYALDNIALLVCPAKEDIAGHFSLGHNIGFVDFACNCCHLGTIGFHGYGESL